MWSSGSDASRRTSVGAFSRPRSTGSRGQRPHTRVTPKSVRALPLPPLSLAVDGGMLAAPPAPRPRSRSGDEDEVWGLVVLVETPRAEARYAQKRRTHSASGMTVRGHVKEGGSYVSPSGQQYPRTHEAIFTCTHPCTYRGPRQPRPGARPPPAPPRTAGAVPPAGRRPGAAGRMARRWWAASARRSRGGRPPWGGAARAPGLRVFGGLVDDELDERMDGKGSFSRES